MLFPMETLGRVMRPGTIGPKTIEWVERVHQRPAYQRVRL